MWKKPRNQGKASSSSNFATNEEQIEVEQRIVIYTCAFKGKYLVMDYLFDMLIGFKEFNVTQTLSHIHFLFENGNG